MVFVRSTTKPTPRDGLLLASSSIVYLRAIPRGDKVDVMTATAGDEEQRLLPYPDQDALMRCAADVLHESDLEALQDVDKQGRPYVHAFVSADEQDLIHFATLILDQLGVVTVCGFPEAIWQDIP